MGLHFLAGDVLSDDVSWPDVERYALHCCSLLWPGLRGVCRCSVLWFSETGGGCQGWTACHDVAQLQSVQFTLNVTANEFDYCLQSSLCCFFLPVVFKSIPKKRGGGGWRKSIFDEE